MWARFLAMEPVAEDVALTGRRSNRGGDTASKHHDEHEPQSRARDNCPNRSKKPDLEGGPSRNSHLNHWPHGGVLGWAESERSWRRYWTGRPTQGRLGWRWQRRHLQCWRRLPL